ncbi:outer membrane beta-barrel protein [Seonamhaeicola sp.]|uniref:outer membrane beta-barrel protein n=1 Tax=Seonamhaeicola sp. TaxID=1912245 RepID=UPI0026208A9B|nr:outer membrane beta-barrel protein [Seonamhaeicola sp.]
MKQTCLCLALFFTLWSFSQSRPFKISGNLISEETNEPLDAATVYLQRVKDSALISYTISDEKGKFILEDKTYDASANLFISYIGYQTYFKNIEFDKEAVDLKTIKLKQDLNNLDEVVINAVAPITIKKDTIEFNVKSFKTKVGATVEDVLKKLPGVEVDQEGKITVNGKEVDKILVNGKPFFGNDPTITTRNLTKDIIEKIQVVDTKTKAQAFTGEQSDSENKTINLTINKENNKGVFGRVSGGLGTDERYEYAGMFNRFDNDQRLSVLAGGNNVNSPGFSFGEIEKMFGGARSVRFNGNGSFEVNGRSFGGGQGITESRNAGVNYADDFGEKLELSSDYFYSGSTSENETRTQRENILPDSRYFTNSNSNNVTDTDNHSFNMGFDIEIDSTLYINIDPSFRYSSTQSVNSNNQESFNESNELINESSSASVVDNASKNFNNRLSLTKKYGANGGFIRFHLSHRINERESEDFFNSEINIYGDNPSDLIRDQFTDGENKTNNVSSNIYYRIPLISNEFFLNLKYNYSNNKEENRRSTYEKDASTNEYDLFNTDLSTDFEYVNEQSIPGIGLSYRKKDWNARVEGSYVFRTLENADVLRPQFNLKRRFEALELSSRLWYRLSKTASMSLSYNLDNTPPSIAQIQPFKDVTDPLNTRVGNPDIKPTNRHRFFLWFHKFDFQKKVGFNGSFSGNVIQDEIVSKTTIDENFVRETTYANVNGNKNFRGWLGFNKAVKIDTLKTIKFNMGGSGNYNKRVNFNNDVKYASKVSTVSPFVEVSLDWKDVMEFSTRYQLNFTKNTYDLESFDNRDFTFHSLHFNTATFLPKHLEWRNNVQYNYNPNIAEGFQRGAWFWNATLSYSFMKEKAILSLKAYDLLNQNTNARRTANQNFIQDSQSTVLQQYFMLGFSWKFNSLGKKGEIRNRNFRWRH